MGVPEGRVVTLKKQMMVREAKKERAPPALSHQKAREFASEKRPAMTASARSKTYMFR